MSVINVDPMVYASSAVDLNTAAQDFYAAFEAQMAALSGTKDMGGSVGECKQWAASYDDIAWEAYSLAGSLAQAMHNYAEILQQAGYNYALADHDPASGRPAPAPPTPLPVPMMSCPVPPPSAGGPGSGLVDDGFELASKVGIPIPDGDPGKLLTAAGIWDTLADSDGTAQLPATLERIAQSFEAVTAPEVEFIDEDLREIKAAAEDLITTFTDLAESCRQQKAAIDDLRARLKGLLQDLAEDIATEVAVTLAFSVLAGALSAGFGAAAVAAYRTGKIAKKVNDWADKIHDVVVAVKLKTAVTVQKSTANTRQKLQRIIDLGKKHGDEVRSRPAALTQKDLDALKDYTGPGYQELNNALRAGTVDPSQQARINAIEQALGKLPNHQGPVFRGTDLPSDVLAQYKPGEVITEKAFTSTSTASTQAFPGSTQFTILSKSGKDVSQYSQYPGEQEILFPPGARFEIVSRTYDPATGKTFIEMVER